jgi:hypothetical protein
MPNEVILVGIVAGALILAIALAGLFDEIIKLFVCMFRRKQLYDFTCLRCGASYKSKVESPDCCSVCHSYDYDRPAYAYKLPRVTPMDKKVTRHAVR